MNGIRCALEMVNIFINNNDKLRSNETNNLKLTTFDRVATKLLQTQSGFEDYITGS